MGTGENITKQDMRYLLPLETRWSDNDQYGHLNNAVYYQLFDTAVNRFLLEHNLLDVQLPILALHHCDIMLPYLLARTSRQRRQVILCMSISAETAESPVPLIQQNVQYFHNL